MRRAKVSVRKQWNFDKTVKPYPERDIYYQIILQDLEDLNKLRKYWSKKHNPPLTKGYAIAGTSASAMADPSIWTGGGGDGEGGHDIVPKQIPYENIYKQIAYAVIEDDKVLATILAREACLSRSSDTLESRVLDRDWEMAKRLAQDRLGV